MSKCIFWQNQFDKVNKIQKRESLNNANFQKMWDHDKKNYMVSGAQAKNL